MGLHPPELTMRSLARGWLLDGVLRRVDPRGRGMAEFVEEEVCKPLGVEHYKLAIPEEEQHKFNIAHIGPPQSTYPLNMEVP